MPTQKIALRERDVVKTTLIHPRSMTEFAAYLIQRGVDVDSEMVAVMQRVESVYLHRIAESQKVPLDKVTGLPGVEVLRQGLSTRLQSNRRHEKVAVVFFDLTGLKPINDEQSHKMGDKVIREVGILLLAHTREDDIVCRRGGAADEFVILLVGLASLEDAVGWVARFVTRLKNHDLRLVNPDLAGYQIEADAGLVYIDAPLEIRQQIESGMADTEAENAEDKSDKLMYLAKRTRKEKGRAVIACAQGILPERSNPPWTGSLKFVNETLKDVEEVLRDNNVVLPA